MLTLRIRKIVFIEKEVENFQKIKRPLQVVGPSAGTAITFEL